MFENSDREWELYGSNDPYFGVLSNEKYLKHNLGNDAREEFWKTGQEHVEATFANIRRYVDLDFDPKTGLDFGCGVGRVLLAMSTRVEHATGVDVSPSMLAEAEHIAREKDINNVSFVASSDCRELKEDHYCLVHSYIVFQHIPTKRGYAILNRLLASLRKGGVGVLHFSYSNPEYRAWKFVRAIPFNKQLRNIFHRRPLNAPFMQMNEYDLNIILEKISLANAKNCFMEFTYHGVHGVTIYFRKR